MVQGQSAQFDGEISNAFANSLHPTTEMEALSYNDGLGLKWAVMAADKSANDLVLGRAGTRKLIREL